MLIFLEGASQSPENCLADHKRTADPSLKTTGVDEKVFHELCWVLHLQEKLIENL